MPANERGTTAKYQHPQAVGVIATVGRVYWSMVDGELVLTTDADAETHTFVTLFDGTLGIVPVAEALTTARMVVVGTGGLMIVRVGVARYSGLGAATFSRAGTATFTESFNYWPLGAATFSRAGTATYVEDA